MATYAEHILLPDPDQATLRVARKRHIYTDFFFFFLNDGMF